MTACRRDILKEIKVVTNINGVQINNALTFENNSLQFRGELVRDTDVWGNYALTFGTSSNKLRQFNVRSSSQTHLEYSNGSGITSLTFNSTGILLQNTLPFAKGLQGGADYSANYDVLSFVQKIYTDTRILGKSVSPTLLNPGAGQNSYTLTWDNTNNRFDLTPGGQITAGADTQVIYNSGGTLVGSPNMTFSSNVFTAPNINIGSTTALPGSSRVIQIISDVDNTGLIIRPKGTGNLILSLLQGQVVIGDDNSSNTTQIIKSNGTNGTIDIALEPKGVSGKIQIGNESEAGGERYIKSRGNLTDIDLVIQSKGTISTITLDPSSDGDDLSGTVKIGNGNNALIGTSVKLIFADSNYQRTDLQIGGSGTTSIVSIGKPTENASNRFLTVSTNSTNCNLKITAKGTGATYIDGRATVKVSIGDWDMLNFDTAAVSYSVPVDNSKIVSIFAKIYEDGSNTVAYDLTYQGDGGIYWNTGVIYLKRKNGGIFQSTTFDATGFNRGYIYITYEE